jgi:hypothetical protein
MKLRITESFDPDTEVKTAHIRGLKIPDPHFRQVERWDIGSVIYDTFIPMKRPAGWSTDQMVGTISRPNDGANRPWDVHGFNTQFDTRKEAGLALAANWLLTHRQDLRLGLTDIRQGSAKVTDSLHEEIIGGVVKLTGSGRTAWEALGPDNETYSFHTNRKAATRSFEPRLRQTSAILT